MITHKGDILKITWNEVEKLRSKGIIIRSEPQIRIVDGIITCWWFEPAKYNNGAAMDNFKSIVMYAKPT